MKLSEKLVVAPLFSNLRIMPKIAEETRIGIDIGLGHTFALGRGDLSGTFKRIKLNLEADDMQLFIEVVSYGFELNNNSQGSLSLGIALVSF
jgi:nucleotidyltransferase/DNA polymerase involved in DNA repair